MNANAEYLPQLPDTSNVVLPESTTPLIKALAGNVHDTWAKGCMDDGWTYFDVEVHLQAGI